MFEPFSRGYLLGRLFVEPHDGDTPVIHEEQHAAMNRRLYADGDGVERLDFPLVMKLEETHFPVLGEDDVPADTLGLPSAYLDEVDRCDLADTCEVLLAKPGRAKQLLKFSGWTPNATAGT
jgi:hypothetical protein